MEKLFAHRWALLAAITILSGIMHFRVFSLDLLGFHVWRQTQTQTVINNFYEEDMNILDPKVNGRPDTDRIMRMEFPVMQWLFAATGKLFGNTVTLSRLLTFIIGLCAVAGIYQLLFALSGNRVTAGIAAWAFNFSPAFYYYTVNPLPDNFALCCAIWATAFFFSALREKAGFKLFLFSAFFLSLGTLAKLPFILYYAVPATWILMAWIGKVRTEIKTLSLLFTYLLFFLPALAWYIWVVPGWTGNGVVKGVADLHHSTFEMLDILQFNLISTLPELLINYASVPAFIFGIWLIGAKRLYQRPLFIPLATTGMAVIAYFLFEMNMIAKVHDYYLFPFLPLIFILVAYGASQLVRSLKPSAKWTGVVLLLLLPVTAYLRANPRWNPSTPGFEVEYYNEKDVLRALVKDGYCVAGNDDSGYILLYYLHAKGWVFKDDSLDPSQLREWRSKGAKYFCSDSRIDTTSAIRSQLGPLLFSKGQLRVYLLLK